MKKYLFLIILLSSFGELLGQAVDCFQATGSAKFLRGIWVGEFHQYSCGWDKTYPLTIEIKEVRGKRVKGYFIWESLPSAEASTARLEGELRGDSIILHETSLVKGGGIVLDGYYFTRLPNCYTMEGKWRLKKAQPDVCYDLEAMEDGGSFQIRKVFNPRVMVPAPALIAPALAGNLPEPQDTVPAPVSNNPVRAQPVEKPAKLPPQPVDPVPQPVLTPDIVSPPVEPERIVSVKADLRVRSKFITLALWDNGREDGDIISLRINGETVLEKYTVLHKAKKLILPLLQKENIIELYAHNLGDIPPNTAAVTVSIGGKLVKSLVLESDMERSEAIRIYKE